MTKKSTVIKKAEATKSSPRRKRVTFEWAQDYKDKDTWLSVRVPEGDKVAARIKRSSKDAIGSHTYFCYRDGSYLDSASSLESAKEVCETRKSWDTDEQRKESIRRIKDYVDNHGLEIPPYLALTENERRSVRENYTYAAPSDTKLRVYAANRGTRGRDAGDDADPSTARLRAELAAAGTPGPGGRRGAAPATGPKPRQAALEKQGEAVLARAREGNPKKAGSAAHVRWEALFAACGTTVAAYAAGGGNMETLANALAKGWVKLEEKE